MEKSRTTTSEVHQSKEFLTATIVERYVESTVQQAEDEYLEERARNPHSLKTQQKHAEYRSGIRTKIIFSDLVTEMAANSTGTNLVSDDEADEVPEPEKRKYSDSSSHGSSGDGGGYGTVGGAGFYKRVRTDCQSNNSGGDGDRDDSRTETQHDTIFIQNLPHNVAPEDLIEVFSQFGIIKKGRKKGEPKILIDTDKATGEGKGEATITFEDEAAAQAAINCYNGKEVLAKIVKISLATRRASTFGGRGKHL